jgi:hypothetical protein
VSTLGEVVEFTHLLHQLNLIARLLAEKPPEFQLPTISPRQTWVVAQYVLRYLDDIESNHENRILLIGPEIRQGLPAFITVASQYAPPKSEAAREMSEQLTVLRFVMAPAIGVAVGFIILILALPALPGAWSFLVLPMTAACGAFCGYITAFLAGRLEVLFASGSGIFLVLTTVMTLFVPETGNSLHQILPAMVLLPTSILGAIVQVRRKNARAHHVLAS